MISISAVIITYNEEANIVRCIQSLLPVVDEVVVIDSYSTDKTIALAERLGARVVQHPFRGFTEQKNFAVAQASHDYILSLDADEYLSDELTASIKTVKASWHADGYRFNRLNSYAGRWVKSCGWYPDAKIRLWDRRKGSWSGGLLHEVVVLHAGAQEAHLAGDLHHLSYRNAGEFIKKIQRYSDIYAQEHAFRKRVSGFKVFYKTLAAFLKNYFLQLGILDGYEGLVISASNANGVLYKYAKLLEANRSLSVSMLVTTYNRKDALELVLKSIAQQSVLPDEVIIADDGSRDDTREMISHYQKTFPVPLKHVWQEDKGFRASLIRNKAIAATSHEYVIMIDGDLVLHRDFVKDHKSLAWRGRFVQGSRVLLTEARTQEVLEAGVTSFGFWDRGIGNRKNTIRSGVLSKLLSYNSKNAFRVRSVNLAAWKADIVRVNGFNIDFEGWGREDSEFAVRMMNAGLKKLHMKFAGFGYHLYHPENSRVMLEKNQAILDTAIAQRAAWCEQGLAQSPQVN